MPTESNYNPEEQSGQELFTGTEIINGENDDTYEITLPAIAAGCVVSNGFDGVSNETFITSSEVTTDSKLIIGFSKPIPVGISIRIFYIYWK